MAFKISPPRSLPSALGYVSTAANGASPDLDAQSTEIEQASKDIGLRLIELVREDDLVNRASPERPGLERALAKLEAGECSCLVVHGLEQLSPTVDELAALIDRLERAGSRLVALDVGLDTASANGRLALERRPMARPPEPVYASDPAEPALPVPASIDIASRALAYEIDGPDSGHGGLEAIERRCAELRLDLVDIIREGQVEGRALERPGLSAALKRIAAREAGCLVVHSLGQLTHSVAELGAIVNWLEQNDVRLITVELELDTSSSGGRLTTRALASVAGWEHSLRSERTRKGIAAAQDKRQPAGWPEVSKRIAAMRADGMTLQAIADVLNAEGVPTPRGGAEWRPSSVQTAAGYRRRSRAKRPPELPPVQRPPEGPSGEKPR